MQDLPSLSIGAIALDPRAPDTIYAGMGEALIVASPSRYLWSYEGNGVYRSTDGGTTWAPMGAAANDYIYRIAVDPFDSDNVLCAGYASAHGGLLRWDRAAGAWILVQPGSFTDVVFDPAHQGVVYAAQYDSGVHKSTNGGATWAPRSTGLPANDIGRVSLTIARSKPDVLYAKIENSWVGDLLGVYRTQTAAEGTTAVPAWTPCIDPGVDDPAPTLVSPQLWWCSYIAADPSDPTGNIVYAGGIDLARSGDGGQSWQPLSQTYQLPAPPPATATRPTHADHHALVFDPTDSTRLFIANDGGVFVGEYTNNIPPVPWRKVSTGLVVTQFYDLGTSLATPSMFGGGCQDNGTIVTTGGLSWRQVHGGDGSYVAFHSQKAWTMWVQRWDAAGRSRIRRSVDGGTTVGGFPDADSGIMGSSEMPVTLLAMDPASPAVLFAGTDTVYRTTNGDVTSANAVIWSAVSTQTQSIISEIAVVSSNLVYAGTMNGHLYRASGWTAGTNSFADVTPQVPNWPTRWLSGVTVVPATPTTPEIVYVTFLGYNGTITTSDQVWKGTLDPMTGQFTSMQNIGGNLPDVPVSALVIDPAALATLYIGTDIGVFRYDGTQWGAFDEGLPRVMVVDLALDASRQLLRAATHGRGVYQRCLAATCREVDVYVRDNTLDTGEVFPSPSGEWDPERPQERVYHWQSADIKVDAPPFDPVDALLDGVEFDDPTHRSSPVLGYPVEDIAGISQDNPIIGAVNRVYVQVHNRGWQKADSLTAKLLWADASVGLPPLPADFWTGFANDTYTQTDWHLVGNVTIANLLAGTPQVLRFLWTPPVGTSGHACLLALIDSPQDPLLPQTELNADVLTRSNKRVTQRNVHPVAAMSSAGSTSAWAVPAFHNAFSVSKRFNIGLDKPRPSRWRARLVLPHEPLGITLASVSDGFEVNRLDRGDWRTMVAHARTAGAISGDVADRLAAFHDPIMLTLPTDRTSGTISGVRLTAGESMPSALIIEASTDPPPNPARFDLALLEGDEPVGGSTFIVRGP